MYSLPRDAFADVEHRIQEVDKNTRELQKVQQEAKQASEEVKQLKKAAAVSEQLQEKLKKQLSSLESKVNGLVQERSSFLVQFNILSEGYSELKKLYEETKLVTNKLGESHLKRQSRYRAAREMHSEAMAHVLKATFSSWRNHCEVKPKDKSQESHSSSLGVSASLWRGGAAGMLVLAYVAAWRVAKANSSRSAEPGPPANNPGVISEHHRTSSALPVVRPVVRPPVPKAPPMTQGSNREAAAPGAAPRAAVLTPSPNPARDAAASASAPHAAPSTPRPSVPQEAAASGTASGAPALDSLPGVPQEATSPAEQVPTGGSVTGGADAPRQAAHDLHVLRGPGDKPILLLGKCEEGIMTQWANFLLQSALGSCDKAETLYSTSWIGLDLGAQLTTLGCDHCTLASCQAVSVLACGKKNVCIALAVVLCLEDPEVASRLAEVLAKYTRLRLAFYEMVESCRRMLM